MGRDQVLKRILDGGIVAVVRAESPERLAQVVRALADGGVTAAEITFTVPDAVEVIRRVRRELGEAVALGAGTVLDPETARIAILAGAQYIVSPSVSVETARLCNRYQVPYMPGAGTMREIVDAMECGADIVKLFPGETLGPAFVKAAKGPLPQASLMPTGGVSVDNVADWIKAGAVAVGVGGSLTAGAEKGNLQLVTDTAKQFVERIAKARGK
jgi:2-dehydro-3-deoxyphosphogluconate aldolase/(4S)-4-hydroxy-2-oxoglutarate aldolase